MCDTKMATHGENEQLSENESNSKSDEGMQHSKQNDPIDFLIVSQIPEKTYKFQWIIRQFSSLAKNIGLYSTRINTLATSCYLKLVKYEHGFALFHESQRKVQSKNSSVSLPEPVLVSFPNSFAFGSSTFPMQQIEQEDSSITNDFKKMLDYHISATDASRKELSKFSVSFSINGQSGSFKIGEYTNSSLENLSDDSLILNCYLKITMEPTSEEIAVASKPSLEGNGREKLSMDLKALYQNSLDTDVTLVVGTKQIRAHKSILSARSTIFKKIFHHDMEEAEQNSVVITDMEFSALERLVEFLYTGVIPHEVSKDMDIQELYDLYYAADKYEVMDLQEMTGNTLLGRVQVENANEILVWVDRHNDVDLKVKIMNFIRINFDAVSNMDNWESCVRHHPKLAAEVVNFCAKKLKTC